MESVHNDPHHANEEKLLTSFSFLIEIRWVPVIKQKKLITTLLIILSDLKNKRRSMSVEMKVSRSITNLPKISEFS